MNLKGKSLPSKRMSAQRELRHGVVVADETDGGGVADLVHDIDATACLFDAEAATGQDLIVTLGMQLSEALAELSVLMRLVLSNSAITWPFFT